MRNFKLITFAVLCTMSFGSTIHLSAQSTLDELKNMATGVAKTTQAGSSLSNIINNVIGSSKITEKDLVGTWKYYSSCCAFQSENLLAQAGGKMAAEKIENKLNPNFSKMGISNRNTYFKLNSDKSFSATIGGKNLSGTYSFNSSTNKILFQGTFLSFTCYATKSGSNLNLLFDSSKLLTVLQTMAKFSTNTTLTTIATLSKNYKGMKMGFMLRK